MSAPGALDSDSNQSLNSLIIQNLLTPTRIGKLLKYLPMSETETVILGVLPDRKKATVKTFLSSIPQRVRQTIHSVCTDMYEGFVNAAKEVFGKHVKIVIDRFHVAKLYRSGLDNLPKDELQPLKQELSEEAYG